MKLLPRLYEPENGRILIDGYDLAKLQLGSVRRQIGIVPQDSLLFDGSIRDNIALTAPDATSAEIEAASRVACALDFIMELPQGYASTLEREVVVYPVDSVSELLLLVLFFNVPIC